MRLTKKFYLSFKISSLTYLQSFRLTGKKAVETFTMKSTKVDSIRKIFKKKQVVIIPSKNQENLVPEAITRNIWLPSDNLIIENAIIGKLKFHKQKLVI